MRTKKNRNKKTLHHKWRRLVGVIYAMWYDKYILFASYTNWTHSFNLSAGQIWANFPFLWPFIVWIITFKYLEWFCLFELTSRPVSQSVGQSSHSAIRLPVRSSLDIIATIILYFGSAFCHCWSSFTFSPNCFVHTYSQKHEKIHFVRSRLCTRWNDKTVTTTEFKRKPKLEINKPGDRSAHFHEAISDGAYP